MASSAHFEISSSPSSSNQSEYVQESDEDTSSTSCNDEYDEEDDLSSTENEEDDKADLNKEDEESSCNKVIEFLRGRSDLENLNLIECKAYLRRHFLRLSGTKGECIERINEHWRLKDVNGEVFYPKSSFSINCTGDVCKGDVVLFNQKVYESFNKIRRHGSFLGRRIVVGRVVKESYGAARQQHTFTVEVLWSKGTNKLAPLFPLLIKGRNLYKMRTYRQRWKNERERLKVLAEKHKRGAAARKLKATRTKLALSANKSFKNEGRHHPKHLHSSGAKRQKNVRSCLNEYNRFLDGNMRRNPGQSSHPLQAQNSKQTGDFRHHTTTYWRDQGLIQSNQVRQPPLHVHLNDELHRNSYAFNPGLNPRELHLPSHRGSSSSSAPLFSRVINPYPGSYSTPYSEFQEFGHDNFIHSNAHFSHASKSRIHEYVPRRLNFYPPFYWLPTGTNRGR